MHRLPVKTVSAALLVVGLSAAQSSRVAGVRLFPVAGATNVNPDTHLTLTFSTPPRAGTSGQIGVYDAETHVLIDALDLSIPGGPGGDRRRRPKPEPVTRPEPEYQRTVIGGFTEGFHFHPVIVRGSTATIYPHNNTLTYGRSYEVHVDRRRSTRMDSTASTARHGPSTRATARRRSTAIELSSLPMVTGDFNTVQGAVDFIPADHPRRVTMFVKAGRYEEIVYFRHKRDITFLGEDRDRVLIGYANNERFNGPPPGVPTNERPETFPYRRAAFMADQDRPVSKSSTSRSRTSPRVAAVRRKRCCMSGGRNLVRRSTLKSHQDTVQFNDSVYVEDSIDHRRHRFSLGARPGLLQEQHLARAVDRAVHVGPEHLRESWIRLRPLSLRNDPRCSRTVLARNTANYPDSEVVLLDSVLGDINPVGWQLPTSTESGRYYMEFGSTRISDGMPADTSQRHRASRQLTAGDDAETIARFRNPASVLDGWNPLADGGR